MPTNKILKIFKFWPILILTMIQAYASQTLAVLEIIPTSEDINVTTTEMRHLSDELRRQAVQTLPKNGYAVLTRDNMLSLLPPESEEAECLAEACAVEIGRAIGAEYVSQGKIGSFSGDLSLSIELYETMSGKLLGSIVMESNDVKGLMGVIREHASELFANLKKVESEELKVESETNNSQFSNLNSQLEKKSNTPFYIALTLDVLGAAVLGLGIYQHIHANKLYDDYKRIPELRPQKEYDDALKKANDAKPMRDIGLCVGAALLSAGIAVQIWF